jgi:hypothetical protein
MGAQAHEFTHSAGCVAIWIMPLTTTAARANMHSVRPSQISACHYDNQICSMLRRNDKLTWLLLGGDPSARSHRVEKFIA